MAVLPVSPLVPVEEYLNSVYRPDLEYVDGVLLERGMPTIAHSVLQRILILYFAASEEALRFIALPEVRTQIIERARYRIPDVMLCPRPLPRGRVVNTVPWTILEILSPDDKMHELIQRFLDYKNLGVRHLVLLDPETFVAYRFEDGSLLQTEFTSLDLPTGSVPFDTAAIFRQLTEKLSERGD